jgi:hypothetical protein
MHGERGREKDGGGGGIRGNRPGKGKYLNSKSNLASSFSHCRRK